MRSFISLSAVAMISSMSLQAQAAAPACANALLSRPAAQCIALQQNLRLSRYQARRVNAIRHQTNQRLSALHNQLHQVRTKLAQALHTPIRSFRLRRLRQKEASLARQIARVRATGASRIAAVMTRRQRARCSGYPRVAGLWLMPAHAASIAVRSPIPAKVTVTPKVTIKLRPFERTKVTVARTEAPHADWRVVPSSAAQCQVMSQPRKRQQCVSCIRAGGTFLASGAGRCKLPQATPPTPRVMRTELQCRTMLDPEKRQHCAMCIREAGGTYFPGGSGRCSSPS